METKNPHILKQYKTQEEKLKAEISFLEQDIAVKRKELQVKIQAKMDIQKKIQKMQRKDEIVVSEHAILRYLERVGGVNLEEIQKKILTDSVVDLIEKLNRGNGQYPVKDGGFVLMLKENTVTTII